MLKIFRNIRKQLLSENKVARYLLYAIGEITLVVIGILIALYVNNWNQERKERIKEDYILEELEKEFREDSIGLERYIRLTDIKATDGRRVKEFLKGRSIHPDTLINDIFFTGKTLIFRSFTPTYDEIVSTGQLDLITNDSLKHAINGYKDNLDGLDEFLFSETQKIKEQYNFHIYRFFEYEVMTRFWDRINRQARYLPLETLGDYVYDIAGYKDDPDSRYYLTMCIGADSELNWIYARSIMPRLADILDQLRKEINKSE